MYRDSYKQQSSLADRLRAEREGYKKSPFRHPGIMIPAVRTQSAKPYDTLSDGIIGLFSGVKSSEDEDTVTDIKTWKASLSIDEDEGADITTPLENPLVADEEPIARSTETYDFGSGPFDVPEHLYGKKGGGGTPVSHSFYGTPISGEGLRGESRKAGDASREVQAQVIEKIIDAGSQAGMTEREIAYTLAIARLESGFNPDAAATSSSASGIGQFIKATGADYGLNDSNRWDVDAQVDALINLTLDNFRLAEDRGVSDEYVYAYHHDGRSASDYAPGLSLSKKEVMPYVGLYENMLKAYRGE